MSFGLHPIDLNIMLIATSMEEQ